MNIVTIVFIGLMIAAMIFFFIKQTSLFNKNAPNNITIDLEIPKLVNTLGVLGTFVGITQSLLGFDANAIESSVPSLLEGMKTAFITSIAGMILSMIMNMYKSYENNKSKNEEENIEDGEELAQIMIKELKTLNATLLDNNNKISYGFETMGLNWNKKQEELIREIKLLDTDMNRKQDELINEFRVFAKTMAEQNSKSLIEALKEVIKDFNSKLTEQFGENFKQLNVAVGKLLEWQENYKEHIETTTNQLETTVKSITTIESSMDNISDKAGVLVEVSDKLNDTLITIDNNQNQIHDNMLILSQVSENAKELIPNINTYFETTNKSIDNLLINVEGTMKENMNKLDNHIQLLTADIAGAVAQVFEELKNDFENSNDMLEKQAENYYARFNSVIDELKSSIPEINEHIQATTQRFNMTLTTFTTEIDRALKLNLETTKAQADVLERTTNNIGSSLATTTNDVGKNIESITKDMSQQIKELIENTENVFKDKVEQLDKTLEKELTNSLNTLGTQLVQISDRFAKDYIPLADKLRDVVNIAEGVIA